MPLTGAATTSGEAGAPAATGDGYGWVKSNIRIDLSSVHQSIGSASLIVPFGFGPDGEPAGAAAAAGGCFAGEGGQAGNVGTGDTVCVDSFFDVFFDVTITDVDTTAGFFDGGGPLMLVGVDIGPMFMQFFGECIADTSLPNLGCLPPVGFPYISHFEIAMDLPDVNHNGFDDVMKFTFGAHNVGDVTNTFVDGQQVIDEFGSTIAGDGAVMDAIADPPFNFTLTGPTTASQGIVYPNSSIPEPTTFALFGAGIALMG